MTTFLIQALLTAVGAGLVLFAKGVLKSRQDGDGFDFLLFIEQNANRLFLTVFGVVLVSIGLALDPGGVEQVLNTLPVALKFGSPLVVGAAIAGVVLIAPANKPKDLGE